MTDGVKLLREWMAICPSRTQSFVAEQVGVGQPSVSGWLREVSRPEPEHRASLELLAGIPPSAWMTVDEQKSVERARKRIGTA